MKFFFLRPNKLSVKRVLILTIPYFKTARSYVWKSFFCSIFLIKFNPSISQNINQYDLLITELMSDPNPTVGLTDDEYLEIYNNSNVPIQLGIIKITIGNSSFQPDSFDLMPYSFKVFMDSEIPTLKNSGDSIIINYGDQIIHKVNYSPSMHESNFKKNGGWSLELIDFSKPCLNHKNWTSSQNTNGGTPGMENSSQGVINPTDIEILSYFPKNDTQLTVTFNMPISFVGTENDYIISNNKATIKIPFMDSSSSDSIFINSVSTCYPSNFESCYLKFGRPQSPDSGHILITEILFNPDSEGSDFIEIYNSTTHPVDLSKLSFAKINNNNELEQAYSICETHQLILPNDYMVVCPNKEWIKLTFPKSKNIIESKIPSMNNDEGHICIVNKSGLILDKLSYQESWHYEELNDTENISLEKIDLLGLNNSSNWTSAATSENYATPGYQNSNFYVRNLRHKNFSIPYKIVTPNSDGYHDQLIIEYNFKNVSWSGQISVLEYSGVVIHNITNNKLFGKNGSLIWDGKLSGGNKIQPGIYILFMNAYNFEKQERIKQKITFYINGLIK